MLKKYKATMVLPKQQGVYRSTNCFVKFIDADSKDEAADKLLHEYPNCTVASIHIHR